jgi:transposase
MDWAQVRELAANGVSQRQIARRLGMDRRTVARLARSPSPPAYRRAPAGSMLDPLEPVMRAVLAEWPQIKAPRMSEILRAHGYGGSVELVKLRLRDLRPPAVRPAQRTGYAPGQVAQIDWTEMASRPRLLGRERRVYALVVALPYSGAQTAHFSFDMSVESFLEGHVRAFEFLGGVPAECVYDNLRAAVARRRGAEVEWAQRFLHLRGHYAFAPHACTPGAAWEKGAVEAAVRYLKSGFWPARAFADLPDLESQ